MSEICVQPSKCFYNPKFPLQLMNILKTTLILTCVIALLISSVDAKKKDKDKDDDKDDDKEDKKDKKDDKGDKEESKQYDDAGVKELLHNKRLLKNFVDCLMERGHRCTPQNRDVREHLPDALKTNCKDCSKSDKKISNKVLKHLIKKEPKYYKELAGKYDPDNVYYKKYEKKMAKKGIKLPPME